LHLLEPWLLLLLRRIRHLVEAYLDQRFRLLEICSSCQEIRDWKEDWKVVLCPCGWVDGELGLRQLVELVSADRDQNLVGVAEAAYLFLIQLHWQIWQIHCLVLGVEVERCGQHFVVHWPDDLVADG